jgi:hypothetical protein
MRILIFILFISTSLFSNEVYESYLEKAYDYFIQKNFTLSLQKLEYLDKNGFEKDWRYFSILGEILEAKGEDKEAIKNYTLSIALNQTNEVLFKKLYELNSKQKKIANAFDFIRLYLSQKDDDIILRYKASLLSKRLGENEYFTYSIKKIQKLNPHDKQKVMEDLKKNKLDKTNIIYLENILPYFPLEKEIHDLRIQYYSNSKNEFQLEEALLEKAILFDLDKRALFDIATFYKKKKKYYKALNLFRRIFYSEVSEKKEFSKESIYFLKECYRNMNRDDYKGFDELEKFSVQEDKISFLKSLSISFPYNREILYLGYIFSMNEADKKLFKDKIQFRDKNKADSEWMNVYGLFLKEDFTEF